MLLDVHGAELFVEDTGGAGEPVLFLHGFLFDGRQFEAQVQALRDRYRCVTLDFRGQGRSGPARNGFQVERQTSDVAAVLRRLDLEPAHLVGLSMGGFVSMRLAARHPDLVRSLTLLNTSAAAHGRVKLVTQFPLVAVARVTGMTLPPVVHGVEAELYGSTFRADADREDTRRVWRERWATADQAALVGTLLGLMVRPDVRPELGDVSAPTLVIAGGADTSLPPAHAREIARLIPNSHYVELAGVGHSSPIEAPEQVTQVLADFLAEVPGTP